MGNRTRIKVVKNKVASPFKVAEVDIMYGHGVSQSGELLDMAVDKDIVDKSGAWYAYDGERIGQGRENVKAYLEAEEHAEMRQEIYDKVRKAYNMDGTADDESATDNKDTEKAVSADAPKGKAKAKAKESETTLDV